MKPPRLNKCLFGQGSKEAMKQKIFNDPVYGFTSVPYGILFDLIEHPYFQRLRRIKQLGLTHYVYPGALHTRFHHAMGALHLMRQAIDVLRSKGVVITEAEAEGVCIAILLHDIGHGPFSHALEHTIVNIHHEDMSIYFMEILNREFNGQLDLAIQIFKNKYKKKFLHQLVSSQLDMDRMDYLNRDSYFTGVSEGVIGYDRIIKMLDVRDDRIVVEEKGIYSIEKFLIARRLMYWQVYLQKTVLSAEQMLIRALKLAKELYNTGIVLDINNSLSYFFKFPETKKNNFSKADIVHNFAQIDDVDIIYILKSFMICENKLLSFVSNCIINRRLFKIELSNKAFTSDYKRKLRQKIAKKLELDTLDADKLLLNGKETNKIYSKSNNEILILMKDGKVLPMSSVLDHEIQTKIITKHYLCYPKNIL